MNRLCLALPLLTLWKAVGTRAAEAQDMHIRAAIFTQTVPIAYVDELEAFKNSSR